MHLSQKIHQLSQNVVSLTSVVWLTVPQLPTLRPNLILWKKVWARDSVHFTATGYDNIVISIISSESLLAVHSCDRPKSKKQHCWRCFRSPVESDIPTSIVGGGRGSGVCGHGERLQSACIVPSTPSGEEDKHLIRVDFYCCSLLLSVKFKDGHNRRWIDTDSIDRYYRSILLVSFSSILSIHQ